MATTGRQIATSVIREPTRRSSRAMPLIARQWWVIAQSPAKTLTLEMTGEDLERGVFALGVGCMPISRRAFIKEGGYLLRQDPVTREELEDI